MIFSRRDGFVKAINEPHLDNLWNWFCKLLQVYMLLRALADLHPTSPPPPMLLHFEFWSTAFGHPCHRSMSSSYHWIHALGLHWSTMAISLLLFLFSNLLLYSRDVIRDILCCHKGADYLFHQTSFLEGQILWESMSQHTGCTYGCARATLDPA